MTDKEYEQQRRECWEEFNNDVGRCKDRPKICFFRAFDRAYALGKVKETITQEEIEKASVEYAADKMCKALGLTPDCINRTDALIPKFCGKDIEEAFEDGANFTLGKQEKEAGTVIQGWAARDKGGFISLFSYRPDRVIHDDLGFWGHDDGGDEIDLPKESFPDLTWESDPEPVEIIIKRKKNG